MNVDDELPNLSSYKAGMDAPKSGGFGAWDDMGWKTAARGRP